MKKEFNIVENAKNFIEENKEKVSILETNYKYSLELIKDMQDHNSTSFINYQGDVITLEDEIIISKMYKKALRIAKRAKKIADQEFWKRLNYGKSN